MLTQTHHPGGSTSVSVSSVCSGIRQFGTAVAKSLDFYLLENSEGLDFSRNNSGSQLAVSSAESDMKNSPAGIGIKARFQNQLADLVGGKANTPKCSLLDPIIPPWRRIIAGGSEPGGTCRTAASLPPSAQSASDSPGMGMRVAADAACVEQRGQDGGPLGGIRDPCVTIPIGLVPCQSRFSVLAGTATASAKVEISDSNIQAAAAVERPSMLQPQQQETVLTVSPAPTWVSQLKSSLPDCSHIPWSYVLQLLAVWVVFVGCQIGRTRVEKCTHADWGIYAAQLSLMLLAGVAFAMRCRRSNGMWAHCFPPNAHLPIR